MSKPSLKFEVKGPKSHFEKSCTVYKFNCFCDRRHIGQISRHLKMRIEEHVPKYEQNTIKGK